MKRTLKVLLGVVALALIGVSTTSAQTGALLGKDLYLFDGGSGTAQNYVQLVTPGSSLMTTNWTLTLPPDGGGTDFILVNTDGSGTTEWQDGLSLFWGIEGNCDPITGWDPNTQTGNYIGHCLNNLDFRSGGSLMNFWFNTMLFPVFTINENGTMTLQTGDGYEGLVIGGQPGGTTGPDAGIVFDCALPPTVAMEVNALAVGILMPTCAPAPLTGIAMEAQSVGLHVTNTPTSIFIDTTDTGILIDNATTAVDATGDIYLRSIGADPAATEILLLDGSDKVVSRTIGAGADIITGSGTLNRQTRWTGTNTIGDAQIIDDGLTAMRALNTFQPNTNATLDLGAPAERWRNAHIGGTLHIGNAGFPLLQVWTGGGGANFNVNGGTPEFEIGSFGGSPWTTIRPNQGSPDGFYEFRSTGLTVSTGAAADLVITESSITRAGDLTINAGAGNNLILPNVPLSASSTKILALNGSDKLEYRTIPATGAIVTGSGTLNTIVLWTPDGAQIGNSIITQDAGATTATVTGNAVVTGTSDLQGNVSNSTGALTLDDNVNVTGTLTVDPTDVSLSATDTRVLTQNGAGLVGYRNVGANGDIVSTGSGTGTTNRLTRWTSTNQIGDGSLDDNGLGGLTRSGAISLQATGGNTLSLIGSNNLSLSASNAVTIVSGANISMTPSNGDIQVDLSASGTNDLTITGLQTNTNTTNFLVMNGNDVEISTINVATTPGGGLTANTALRTNGTGQIESVSLPTGEFLAGTATGPAAFNLVSPLNSVSITVDAANTEIELEVANPIPAGTTNNSTLRWNSGTSTWQENTGVRTTTTNGLEVDGNTTLGTSDLNTHLIRGITSINTAGAAGTAIGATTNVITLLSDEIYAANLPNDGDNTDYFVVWETTGSTGQLRTASVATMIGGVPWVLGGNTTGVTGANNILGINYVSGQPLRMYVENFEAAQWATDGALTQYRDFISQEDVSLGNENTDLITVQGAVSINDGPGYSGTIAIGNSIAGTTNINSVNVRTPNLPGTVGIDEFVTRDPVSKNLSILASTDVGYPWVVGGNAFGGASSYVLGTTTADALELQANGVTHVSLTAAGTTSINDGASTGDVVIGQNTGTPNAINLNSPKIYALNIEDVVSEPIVGTEHIVVWDSNDGELKVKDLGAPVQKVKTDQVEITGTGAVRVFTILDPFIQNGAIIQVTLQDGGSLPDANDYTVSVLNVAAGQFDVRLSGFMANNDTKLVNYTITNP